MTYLNDTRTTPATWPLVGCAFAVVRVEASRFRATR